MDKDGAEFSSLFPLFVAWITIMKLMIPTCGKKACPTINYNADLKRKMFQEYSQMQRNAGLRLTFMTKRMNRPMEDTRFAVASYDDVCIRKKKNFLKKWMK